MITTRAPDGANKWVLGRGNCSWARKAVFEQDPPYFLTKTRNDPNSGKCEGWDDFFLQLKSNT